MIGDLRTMTAQHDPGSGQVRYDLRLEGCDPFDLNPLVGQRVCFRPTGLIRCQHCGRETKKSFQQGYCYPCTRRLAACDLCMVRPDRCHHHQGTCREEDFARSHCFIGHTLYLARSSSVKVGITRSHRQCARWIDQGAVEALEVGHFADRFQVGKAEATVAAVLPDRTDWRAMLKGTICEAPFEPALLALTQALDEQQRANLLPTPRFFRFVYPVQDYPKTVKTVSLDAGPVAGLLLGIKGQYLILEQGVLSMRRFVGYQVEFSTPGPRTCSDA